MESLQSTLDERGSEYGDFAEMASVAQDLKAMLLADDMNVVEKEAVDLICTKLARISCGNPHNKDSWTDIAGYAMLVVEYLERRGEAG